MTVFENRVQRKMFRPMREEVRGGWRKLFKVELKDLFSSPYIINGDQVEDNVIILQYIIL